MRFLGRGEVASFWTPTGVWAPSSGTVSSDLASFAEDHLFGEGGARFVVLHLALPLLQHASEPGLGPGEGSSPAPAPLDKSVMNELFRRGDDFKVALLNTILGRGVVERCVEQCALLGVGYAMRHRLRQAPGSRH